MAEDVDAALSYIDAATFELRLGGWELSVRAGGRGRCGPVSSKPKLLDQLQAKIEAACGRSGLPPEGRKFHPHVTLARCKNVREAPAAEFAATYPGFDLPAIVVDAFTLYSSQMGRSGAVYSAEAVYPLE